MIPGVDNDVGEYKVESECPNLRECIVCEWNQVICKIDISALSPTNHAENLMVSSLQLTLKNFLSFQLNNFPPLSLQSSSWLTH